MTTDTQLALLRWLDRIGGVCVVYKDRVCHPDAACPSRKISANAPRDTMPALSALHLIQLGAIEANIARRFQITDCGRRLLKP